MGAGDDLFNPETLKLLGVRLGSGVATGAAAGLAWTCWWVA